MEAHRANGEAAATWILVATRRPGSPPVSDEASEPWRVALQAGPGAFTPTGRADEAQRWQSRRAETVLAAAVARRHAAAAALDGKRKGVIGHSRSTCCGSARLAQARDGSPITTYQPRPPRARDASPGCGRPCFAAARAGLARADRRLRSGRVSTALTDPCQRFPGAVSVCP